MCPRSLSSKEAAGCGRPTPDLRPQSLCHSPLCIPPGSPSSPSGGPAWPGELTHRSPSRSTPWDPSAGAGPWLAQNVPVLPKGWPRSRAVTAVSGTWQRSFCKPELFLSTPTAFSTEPFHRFIKKMVALGLQTACRWDPSQQAGRKRADQRAPWSPVLLRPTEPAGGREGRQGTFLPGYRRHREGRAPRKNRLLRVGRLLPTHLSKKAWAG